MALERMVVGNIDGGELLEEMNRGLEQVKKDVFDRPQIERPRTLIVEIAMTPAELDKDLRPKAVLVEWKIKKQTPGTKAKTVGMVDNGEIMVSRFERDARQGNLLDFEEEQRKKAAQEGK